MTATEPQIDKVRRMTAERTLDNYQDAEIAATIEDFPLLDINGNEKYLLSAAVPPALVVNPDWIPTYDLNAAAAEIWKEKAAEVSRLHDFDADGGSFDRSKIYEQYMANVRYYRSQRVPATTTLKKFPKEVDPRTWIGNLPEPD